MPLRLGHAPAHRSQPARRSYQVYHCAGRDRHGLHHRAQPVTDRAVIDEAMLDELGRRYLDIDETRRRL